MRGRKCRFQTNRRLGKNLFYVCAESLGIYNFVMFKKRHTAASNKPAAGPRAKKVLGKTLASKMLTIIRNTRLPKNVSSQTSHTSVGVTKIL